MSSPGSWSEVEPAFPVLFACVLASSGVVKLKGRTRRLLPLMSQPGLVVQRDNEWHAVYADGTADVYVNSAIVHG